MGQLCCKPPREHEVNRPCVTHNEMLQSALLMLLQQRRHQLPSLPSELFQLLLCEFGDLRGALTYLCKTGDLYGLQHWHSVYGIQASSYGLDILVSIACTSGTMYPLSGRPHMEVVMWLHDTFGVSIVHPKMLQLACCVGHLQLAQLLHMQLQLPADYYVWKFALYAACRNDHMAVLVWLRDTAVFTPAVIDEALNQACVHGRLRVAMWLCDAFSVDRSVCRTWAFYQVCANGHLGTAQWMYDTFVVMVPNEYNLARGMFVLSQVIQNGHWSVAEWMGSVLGLNHVLACDNSAWSCALWSLV